MRTPVFVVTVTIIILFSKVSDADPKVYFAGVATMPCSVVIASKEAMKYAITWTQGYIGGVDWEVAKLGLDTSDEAFSQSKTGVQNYQDLETILSGACMVSPNSDIGDIAPYVRQGLINLNR